MRHHSNDTRVTIDLDDATEIDLLRAVYGLEREGAKEVESRVSSSGTGFHVRAWFDREDMDDERREVLRRLYGDHGIRIELDRTHYLKPKQMLFTRKGDKLAGPWRSRVDRTVHDFRAEANLEVDRP